MTEGIQFLTYVSKKMLQFSEPFSVQHIDMKLHVNTDVINEMY